jgi:hypothetical protein
MEKLFLFLFISICFFSCKNADHLNINLSEYIPSNSSTIIKISDFELFQNDIEESDFFKLSFKKNSPKYNLDILKDLNISDQTLLCMTQDDDTTHLSIITKYHDSLVPKKSIDASKFYNRIIDSVYVLSTSEKIINSLKSIPNKNFEDFLKLTKTSASFSILKQKKHIVKETSHENNEQHTSESFVLDVHANANEVNLNGIMTSTGDTNHVMDIFSYNTAQETTIARITPNNCNGFINFTFGNYEKLKLNIQNHREFPIDSTSTDFWLNSINEIGEIYYENHGVVIAKSIDPSITLDGLTDHQELQSVFRDIQILKFESPKLLSQIFKPLLSSTTLNYYALIDHYFIFAESQSNIEAVISNYKNGTTFFNDLNFQQSSLNLSNEASLLSVIRGEKLPPKTFEMPFEYINFDKYEFKALQLVQDEEFMHVNIHVNNFKPVSRPNTITEEFNTKLDADILTTPQFVSNHRNKQRDIIVQDINNDLYLINNGGKILWKKQLDGNILGKVNQIDAYKNGRLQFVFNTPHRTYLIDRNGKDVGPFPLKFQNEITQPLSVFDYDSNKNYRLLVTQNDALLMYDARGKKITGFSYKKNNPILKQPKHFRLSGKDYIVFATAEKMKILNRKGKTRINIKESVNFSNNDIYLYKNQFTTTSKKGELIQVNTKGVMSKQSLKLDSNHAVVATSKTLSFLSENYITIKQKTKQLDFGFYTSPVIFYLNDKIYVSVTDLQSKKVYLFDSSANIQNNFPVYGNSQIELENMDNDTALEILTTGDSNSIIVYQKN